MAGQGPANCVQRDSGRPGVYPAILFGVAAVNQYYGYYQSWGAITADFTNQGVNNLPQAPHLGNKRGNTISRLGLSPEARAEAAQTGYLFDGDRRQAGRDLPDRPYLSAAAILPVPVRSLQCLNAVGGLKDATYVAEDVPDFVAAGYRVQPPGQAWGVAGLSEGGFCAANLALQYPNRFGDAGSMSGYFALLDNLSPRHDRIGAPPFTPCRSVATRR